MVILTFEKVKVLMSPLCVVDIEMFTDEEAKGAESAKDEQQEGREELRKKYFFSIKFWGNSIVNFDKYMFSCKILI